MGRGWFEVEGDNFGVEDYTGTISEVRFESGDYGWQMVVVNKLDEPTPKNDGTLRTEGLAYYSLPKTWVSRDGGASVIDESGDLDARPNANTQFGKLLKRVGALAADAFTSSPYEAASWTGLRFQWKTEGKGEGRKQVEGEWVKDPDSKGKLMPVRFLGGGVASNGATTTFDPTAILIPINLPSDIHDALTGIAQTHTSEKFEEEALKQLVGVREDPQADQKAYLAAVSSGELYEALRA